MANNIGIIISREFSERVAKKSFIITTLLMPVLMLVLTLLPAAIMVFSTPSHKTVAVIDRSGIILPALAADKEDFEYLTFVAESGEADSLARSGDFDGVLWIGSDIVADPSQATLLLTDAGSLQMEGALRSTIRETIEQERLKSYDIDNLQEILDEIHAEVPLTTSRISDSGEAEASSTALSYAVGIAMTFVLYMFLLIYGQMVMTSIIEEKNNRVLELVVSSVKPLHLMLGKILGVGLVAVVQVLIWGVIMMVISGLVLPVLMPAELSAEVAMSAEGTLNPATATFDTDLLGALGVLSSPLFIAKIFGLLLLFLIGGFLFYAAIFAAIGSAVDNIQDASQLQTFAILPIIIGIISSLQVASDPNSQLAVWLSMIPLTSPMVMLARVPFGIASWQIALSLVLLYLSFIGMTWIAAKIYRVGIFMYGKKPTLRDLIRWARSK